MSIWTARLIAPGGHANTGGLIDRLSIGSLGPLLRGVPVCAHWTDNGFTHPSPGAPGFYAVDREAIIGMVCETRPMPDGIHGVLSIGESPTPVGAALAAVLDRVLLTAERRGRLVETLGLSVHGVAHDFPRDDGEVTLWWTKVFSLDVVDRPLSGGHFIQSDIAERAGAAVPTLPTIIPRPARESRDTRRQRDPSIHEPLSTEFHVIPEGADY